MPKIHFFFTLSFLVSSFVFHLGCAPTIGIPPGPPTSYAPNRTRLYFDTEIVAGKGIEGMIRLGDSGDLIESRLGPANENYNLNIGPNCERQERHWFDVDEPGLGIFAYLNKTDSVFQIHFSSPKYSTDAGIRFETDIKDVKIKIDPSFQIFQATGTKEKINGGRDLIYIVSENKGIAFEMYYYSQERTRKVGNIIIFPAGTHMIPTGCQPEWRRFVRIENINDIDKPD